MLSFQVMIFVTVFLHMTVVKIESWKMNRIMAKSLTCLTSLFSFPLLAFSDADVDAIQPTDRGIFLFPAANSTMHHSCFIDNQLVQVAFRDFDQRRFDASAKEFTLALNRWKELHRPRDEIVSLLKARANVYLDNKNFEKSIADDDEAIALMFDGQKDDGTAKYPEYPDTFVSRALAKEGLADWNGALEDYNKAITLWGGGRGEGVNPFVLTFRGNTLCRLNRYADAVPDYEAASNIFIASRDIDRYSDASANLALALYEVGQTDRSVKIMNDVIRKNPGYSDMHIAIAAHSWDAGDYITALKEWRFACDKISVGCKAYEDEDWLRTVRRWPPSLIEKFEGFLQRRIPEKLKGDSTTKLAPASSV
jgi:hypothetical protein